MDTEDKVYEQWKEIQATCAYCEQIADVRKWDKTGELVCYECRLEFLDKEFNR